MTISEYEYVTRCLKKIYLGLTDQDSFDRHYALVEELSEQLKAENPGLDTREFRGKCGGYFVD